jgi:hypothetical protein
MNRVALSILIASVLLLSGARNAQSNVGNDKNKHQAGKDHQETEQKSDQAQQAPLVSIIIQPAPAPQGAQATSTQEQPHAGQEWHERPTITDWGLLIVTAVYAGTAIGLFIVGIKSANAATRSADAAAQANQNTREALVIAERAYVVAYPDPAQTPILTPNQKAVVKLIVRDQGHTPALRLTIKAWMIPMAWPDTTEQQLLEYARRNPETDTASEITLFPNVRDFNVFVETKAILGEATVRGVMDGTKERLYIWGRAAYWTFRAPHYTNFCVTFGGRATYDGFNLTPFHNDAD